MSRNGSNTRPKLELKLNESVQVRLLRDKPYEGHSPYGTYALYTVSHDGVEKAFFAPQDLVPQIDALDLKSGDEFLIRKVAKQNGRKLVSNYVVERETPRQEPPVVSASHFCAKEDRLKEIMEQSLREAVQITRSVPDIPFQNEDIQKIASCLFIART